MTEREIQNILNAFALAISQTDFTGAKKINFFSATKMLTLETKHSAFFAWLLDPKNEHCLNNSILKKLLSRLYGYNTLPDVKKKSAVQIVQNKDILKSTRNNSEISISSAQQLTALADASNINVSTEYATDNAKRVDILIDIADSQTVILIENKIDSSTHDNQICEYQSFVFNSKYSSYKKKIFIYLSKDGELPLNTGGDGKYNSEWCVLDYSEIRKVIDEVLCELNNIKHKYYQIDANEKAKLIIILEDYKNMIDTNILNTSSVARNICKTFLSDPVNRAAFDILTAYEKIPKPDQITDYVCEKLGGLREGSSKSWFYTESMKNYFTEENKEEYSISKLRCVCQPEQLPKNSPIVPRIFLYINLACDSKSPDEMTEAQKKLLKKCGEKETKSDGSPRRDVTLKNYKITLVEREERGLNFEDLKKFIDPRIEQFTKLLEDFEKKLKSIK